MRIATYNVEWMTELFSKIGAPLVDGHSAGRHGVSRAQQLEALGIVFTAMDADAVLVVEAPDESHSKKRHTVPALENFAALYQLRCRKAVIGFANHTEQEIALLYDPDVLQVVHDPKGDEPEAPQFDGTFRIDLDIDATLDVVHFSKPPLELELRPVAGGPPVRMIGVHVKSKAPHGARSKADVLRLSIANRRKQLAQCIWLRRRVEAHLAARDPLIVLGDFNDGPGLDEYESLFGRSGVEIVLGRDAPPEMRMSDPHAERALLSPKAAKQTTARFYIAQEKRYLSAMLDYIMVSPGLAARQPQWRIWHPFDDPGLYQVEELREALLTASDHFPVTLDIDL